MENTQAVTSRKTSHIKAGGWLTALFALVMGCAALLTVVQNPAAIPMAILMGVSAIAVRVGYNWTRTTSKSAEEATAGNLGLVIAGIAVAPLIAFALLWTSLLLIIGAAWVLHMLGLA